MASKIRKVQEKSGQRYYHSNDIFREVGSESENEDSEAEVANIELELERLHIGEITDVSERDK